MPYLFILFVHAIDKEVMILGLLITILRFVQIKLLLNVNPFFIRYVC